MLDLSRVAIIGTSCSIFVLPGRRHGLVRRSLRGKGWGAVVKLVMMIAALYAAAPRRGSLTCADGDRGELDTADSP